MTDMTAELSTAAGALMRLDRLVLRCYRHLLRVDVMFPDGLVGIAGPNGSGKTSLLEAIMVALYGFSHSRTSKQALLSTTGRTTKLRFWFSLGEHHFEVRRELAPKRLAVKAQLFRDGVLIAEGNEPVSAEIISLVGSPTEFLTSRFVRQKKINELSSGMDPEKRRRVIMNLLGIGAIDTALKTLREQAREIDADIKARRAVLPNITELRRSLRELEAARRELERAGREIGRKLDKRTTASAAAEARLATADAAAESAAQQAATLHLVDAALEELGQEQAALTSRAAEEPAARAATAALESHIAAIEAARGELDELERAYALRRRIAELEAEQRNLVAEQTRLDAELARLGSLSAREAELGQARAASYAAAEQAGRDEAVAEASRGEARAALLSVRTAIRQTEASRASLRDTHEAICPTCSQAIADLPSFAAHLAEQADSLAAEESAILARGTAAKERSEQAVAERAAALRRLGEIEDELVLSRAATSDARLAAARRAEIEEALAVVAAAIGDAIAVPYDEARHAHLSAEATAYPGLTHQLGEARLRLAEIERTNADLTRLAERRAGLGARRTEAAAAAKAAGYLPEEHLAAREAARLAREEATAAALEQSAHDGALARSDDALGHLAAQQAEHRRLSDEIEAMLADRSDLSTTNDKMKEFRLVLIGRIRPRLSARASETIRELTEGYWTEVSINEEYDLSFGADGVLKSIDEASGAEEDIINLALRLAIADEVAETTGVGASFIVLDEVMTAQTPDRMGLIMQMLDAMVLRYAQVVIVDHHPSIQEMLPNLIEVQLDRAVRQSKVFFRPDGVVLPDDGLEADEDDEAEDAAAVTEDETDEGAEEAFAA